MGAHVKRATSVVVALVTLAGACHRSDPGARGVREHAHDSVALVDLSEDEAREACDDVFPLLRRLDDKGHHLACAMGAELASQAKGAPSRCHAEYDDCVGRPPMCGERRTHADCPALLRRLACAATVGELAACAWDLADTLDTPLRAVCTKPQPANAPASPASCELLVRKCPSTSSVMAVSVGFTNGGTSCGGATGTHAR